MKIIKYLFFFCFLFFSELNIYDNLIVLPIETLSQDNYLTGNYSLHQEIIRKSLFKSLYAIFQIGTPVQKIPLFIKLNEIEFEITSLTIKNENLLQYHLTYNLSSIFNKYDFYNENKSSTFQTEGCKNNHNIFSDHIKDCISNETIYFYQDKNFEKLLKIKNFEFNLVKDKEENITGILGMGLFDNMGDKEKNFLKILKRNNLIKTYNWYFNFDSWNNSNGKLVIGSLPHEDYPDLYLEEDLLYTHIIQDFSAITKFIRIEFDEIHTNQINSSFYIRLFATNAKFVFDSDITIGTSEFEAKIKDRFFINYIEENKCFEENFKQSIYYYNQLKFFYCDINLKDTLYEILPSIKFVSKDFNFIFELTKDELFKIEGKYIYLLILFDSGRQNNWVLGRSITLKYPFIFNSENNKVGFYQKYKTKMNSEFKRKKFNKAVLIFILIILSFILVILGIYIGKIIYGIQRKKRANELQDNYEYISDNNVFNKDINNNIKYIMNDKNNSKNKNINSSIEMKLNSI